MVVGRGSCGMNTQQTGRGHEAALDRESTALDPATRRRSRLPMGAASLAIAAVAGVAGVAASAGGCTTYHAVAGAPRVGEQVRAQLTAVGQVRHASSTGVARTALDGSVLAVDEGEIVLVVPIPGLVPAYQRSPKVADTLHVARGEVTAFEVQRFSAARSALLAGGVVATGVLGVAFAGHAGSSDPSNDPRDRTALRPWWPIVAIPIGR